MNDLAKNLLLWVVILVVLISVFQSFANRGSSQEPLAYSDFLEQVESGQVKSVKIDGQQITGTYTSGAPFVTYAPEDPNLVGTLTQRGVRVEAIPPDNSISLAAILLNALPILILVSAPGSSPAIPSAVSYEEVDGQLELDWQLGSEAHSITVPLP